MHVNSTDALISYMRLFDYIYPAVEGRIKYIGVKDQSNLKSGSSAVTPFSIALISAALLLTMCQLFSKRS